MEERYSVELVEYQAGAVPKSVRGQWRKAVSEFGEWLAALQMPDWVEWKAREKGWYCLALVRNGNGELVSVSPLREEKFDLLFSVGRRCFFNFTFSPLLVAGNVPVMPETPAAYDVFFDALARNKRCKALLSHGVLCGSVFHKYLERLRKGSKDWIVYSPYPPAPRHFIEVHGAFREYLAQFTSKERRQLRRELRLLRKAGNGELELARINAPGQVDFFVHEARSIAQKSWQKVLGNVSLDDPSDRVGILRLMAESGLLRCYLLRVGCTTCAYLMGFQINGVFLLYETAYHDQWREYSPGKMLLYLVIEDAFDVNSPNIVYFGPGERAYKHWFANRQSQESGIFIARKTVANRLKVGTHRAFRAGVEFVKSIRGSSAGHRRDLTRFSRITSHFAFQLRSQGLRATLRSVTDRLCIRWFEWRLGIRSESIIELKEFGIEDKSYRPYVPTDYRSFLKVIDALRVCPGRDAFLDFGSGLGRAVILAATRPFRRVVGVEIVPQLNDAARENVRRALPRLKCRDIELVTANAMKFAIPADITIIYFFNPFVGEALRTVLDNIRESLRQHPRALRLICKLPAQSAFEREIQQHMWLSKERELVFDVNSRYLFLSSRV